MSAQVGIWTESGAQLSSVQVLDEDSPEAKVAGLLPQGIAFVWVGPPNLFDWEGDKTIPSIFLVPCAYVRSYLREKGILEPTARARTHLLTVAVVLARGERYPQDLEPSPFGEVLRLENPDPFGPILRRLVGTTLMGVW